MSRQTTALQRGQQQSGVSVVISHFISFCLTSLAQVLQGMSAKRSAQIVDDLTAYGQYQVTLTAQVDPILKPSNEYTRLPNKHPSVHAAFEDRP